VSFNDLTEKCTLALTAAGEEPARAAMAADSLVYAEASGIASHGVIRLPYLYHQLRSGKIAANAEISSRSVGQSAYLVNANGGLGVPACKHAIDGLTGLLSRSPVAIATVSHSHHFGPAGYFTEALARNGYVGIAVSGTAGAIAPIGSSEALLGNPPISMAFPLATEEPAVIDLAPAVTARGNILEAASREDSIPDTWALDERGQPTTDAAAALKGTLRAIGDHKGIVLALMLDLFVATFTESSPPSVAGSPFAPEGNRPDLGHVFLGIDSRALDISAGAESASSWLSIIESNSAMRVPGARRRENRANARRYGVEISDAKLRAIEDLR
jgi:(2R)-3-sulfolactate dehydrogenase (NADP+)